MDELTTKRIALAALWTGRGLAVLLFLFWGAFFFEHLGEWFVRPKGMWPPPSVWVAQAMHAAMLAGLIMIVRWDKTGAAIMAVATVAFFSVIGMNRFPWIALINAIPLPFLAVYWWLMRKPS